MKDRNSSTSSSQESGTGSSITRRSFFARMIGIIAAIIGTGIGFSLLTFAIKPTLRRKEVTWADAGPVSDLTVGIPKDLSYVATSMDGWLKESSMQSVWAELAPDGSVRVFSPSCPHLGCAYHWDSAFKEFKCPCHGSIFAFDGKAIAGPAPRPLDTLPSKVENGRIMLKFIKYQAGLPKKIPV